MTVPALLDACLRRTPGRPLLTFYDHQLGEQTELSVATTANWVNKSANLLLHGVGAEPGQSVRLHLPVHWASAVWMLGTWTAGLVLALDDEPADIHVVGPDDLEDSELLEADEVLAVSLTTLGTRFTEPLPIGVWDYHGEVLGFGDHFSPSVRPSDPAVRTSDGTLSHDELIERAAGREYDPLERLMTDQPALEIDLVALLAVDGSLVLVRHPDLRRLPDLARDERVTAGAALDWRVPTTR